MLSGHPELSTYEIIRRHWQQRLGETDFANRWRKALHDGLVPDTRAQPREVTWSFADKVSDRASPASGQDRIELSFCPDPTVWDGRFANNGWLQELPKPMTKLTWDNAAIVSPETAERFGISNHDLVDLSIDVLTVRAPVWIMPGQPDDSISLAFGYGRTRSGRIGNGEGVNAYALRTARQEWFVGGVELKRTDEHSPLAVTQNHYSMEGRGLVQVGTLAEFAKTPISSTPSCAILKNQPTLFPKYEESENAWGMVIDQTACMGCNACVVACQAENNIPIVGKEQVAKGREMQWLRIDRYYKGTSTTPKRIFSLSPACIARTPPANWFVPWGRRFTATKG